MRKNVFGRKFKRDANERKALFKSLISALILNGSIKTTLEKAKAIKGDVDKIVNKAKKGGKEALYLLQTSLNKNEIKKIIDIAPMFSDRNSGYTKMAKLGRRFSDNAAMVQMEWVVKEVKNDVKSLPAVKVVAKNKKTVTTASNAADAETQKKRETRKKRSVNKK